MEVWNGRNQHDSWEVAESGEWIMPERQRLFLEWTLTPTWEREPKTLREWAQQHEVAESTCRRWRQDRRFKEIQERRMAELNIRPDRIQEIYDTLWKRATQGTGPEANKAAELYLSQANKLNPQKVIVEDKGVRDLTDDELKLELQRRMQELEQGHRG